MNIRIQSLNKRYDLIPVGQCLWVGKGHRLLNDLRFLPTTRERKLDSGATYIELKKVIGL